MESSSGSTTPQHVADAHGSGHHPTNELSAWAQRSVEEQDSHNAGGSTRGPSFNPFRRSFSPPGPSSSASGLLFSTPDPPGPSPGFSFGPSSSTSGFLFSAPSFSTLSKQLREQSAVLAEHTELLSNIVFKLRKIDDIREWLQEGVGILNDSNRALREDIRLLRKSLIGISSLSQPEFPQFRKLPPELRRMIWEWATPRKVLEIHQTKCICNGDIAGGEIIKTELRFSGDRRPPVTAQVCRESRLVACRTGKLIRHEALSPYFGPRLPSQRRGLTLRRQWAWFDSERDTLYIRTPCGTLHVSRYPYQDIRHVMLDYYPEKHDQAVLELLGPKSFPELKSIEHSCMTVQLRERSNTLAESGLFGSGRHVAIPVVTGDAIEGKQVCQQIAKALRLDGRTTEYIGLLITPLYGKKLAKTMATLGPVEDYPKRVTDAWLTMGFGDEVDNRMPQMRKRWTEMVKTSMYRRVLLLVMTEKDVFFTPPA